MMRYLLEIALDWARRSFPDEQMKNPATRSLRVVEEAIELAQACDVPLETVLSCANIVYSRPKGDVTQEVGGVLMTIYLFVGALGWLYGGDSPINYFVKELRRVLAKPAKHFADRNAEKTAMGLDVPTKALRDKARHAFEQAVQKDLIEWELDRKGDHKGDH